MCLKALFQLFFVVQSRESSKPHMDDFFTNCFGVGKSRCSESQRLLSIRFGLLPQAG